MNDPFKDLTDHPVCVASYQYQSKKRSSHDPNETFLYCFWLFYSSIPLRGILNTMFYTYKRLIFTAC